MWEGGPGMISGHACRYANCIGSVVTLERFSHVFAGMHTLRTYVACLSFSVCVCVCVFTHCLDPWWVGRTRVRSRTCGRVSAAPLHWPPPFYHSCGSACTQHTRTHTHTLYVHILIMLCFLLERLICTCSSQSTDMLACFCGIFPEEDL